MTRAGRRPGPTCTREDIIDSARALFAELGYERTTIRAIARRAGVNPALVHHFYRTKDELLIAAVQLPFDPQAMIANAFAEPNRIGEALIRSLLALWDIPEIRDRMLALIRAAVTQLAEGVGPALVVVGRDVVVDEFRRGGAVLIERRHARAVGVQVRDRAQRPRTHVRGQRVARSAGHGVGVAVEGESRRVNAAPWVRWDSSPSRAGRISPRRYRTVAPARASTRSAVSK